MTRNTPAAALACFLFAFDFMHFTQTRIATIDVYITFFVIAMYYFMYYYCSMSFTIHRCIRPLCLWAYAASAWDWELPANGPVSMRAVDWHCCFLRICCDATGNTSMPKPIPEKHQRHGASADCKEIPGLYGKDDRLLPDLFVLVPAVIYLLSYLPFVDNSHPGLFDRMLTNQTSMFNYHSGLEATHPYSSSWYQWPTMVRPIWYYSGYLTDAVKEGISAFGNPVVWWIGILAFIYILYLLIRNNAFLCSLTGHTQTECSTDTATTLSHREYAAAAFLAVGYLAQYLPWFFVTRITFIYHYFPSVPL